MKAARSSMSLLLVGACALAVLCAPAAVVAATIKVSPGESIQAAIDAASPGDKILVFAGEYTETHGGPNGLQVNKPLKLIGKKKSGQRPVLLAGPGQEDGIHVEPDDPNTPIDGFMIKGFVIQGFPGNGIHLRYVNNFRIEKNETADNLENGIFPTLSANGMVKKNVSYGSEDTALWVEASENVRVLKNILHSSPTGLEVTVSNNVEMKGNEVYNNVIGIGIYHPNAATLPAPPEVGNLEIVKNRVYDNNLPNSVSGGLVGEIPTGGGILVLGVSDVTVANNTVENNGFYGVAMVDWCLAVADSSFNCDVSAPIADPAPRNNVAQNNKFIGNGTAPGDHPLAPLAADIVHIAGPDLGNCFSGNAYTTTNLFPAPEEDGGPLWDPAGGCL